MKPPIRGSRYEEQALAYLKKHHLKLIAKNFHAKTGEIDLIMVENQTIVFVEVRYRKSADYGSSLESINYTKQQKIKKTAQYFLYRHAVYQKHMARFDVIAIDGDKLEWVKAAFY